MTVKEALEHLDAARIEWEEGYAYQKPRFEALDMAIDALKAQEPPTNTSISSAIECLLHPQDADDSDMAKAIDTAVHAMRLLTAQEPRLITEADFENADEYGFIPAWYEGLVNKEGWWNCIHKEALETAKKMGVVTGQQNHL